MKTRSILKQIHAITALDLLQGPVQVPHANSTPILTFQPKTTHKTIVTRTRTKNENHWLVFDRICWIFETVSSKFLGQKAFDWSIQRVPASGGFILVNVKKWELNENCTYCFSIEIFLCVYTNGKIDWTRIFTPIFFVLIGNLFYFYVNKSVFENI